MSNDLAAAFTFLAAASLVVKADQLYHEAQQAEVVGCPNRSYNRRRKADDLMGKARKLCGDRGLPWGVK